MSPDPGAPPGDEPGRPPRKPPSAYRPDLRPMLILGGLLAAVVVGWVLLSPLILPRAAQGDGTAALAGRWTLSRDDPASSTLALSAGTYRLEGALDFRGSGAAAYLDGRLTVSDDPACPGVVGRYGVTLGDVDRYGLLPQFRAQSMTLEAVDDACAGGLRASTLAGETWILRTSQRPHIHGVCDPPNEEAAVTGHWPQPTGC